MHDSCIIRIQKQKITVEIDEEKHEENTWNKKKTNKDKDLEKVEDKDWVSFLNTLRAAFRDRRPLVGNTYRYA